jgi:hypothetical protein
MFLYVFWISTPWEHVGSKPGHELHAIRAGDDNKTPIEHISSPLMGYIVFHIAPWLLRSSRQLSDCITFEPPADRADLRERAQTLSDEEKKKFLMSLKLCSACL